MLDDLRRGLSISVTEVNILADMAIYERYKYQIPVIEIENGPTLKAPFAESELRRALSLP